MENKTLNDLDLKAPPLSSHYDNNNTLLPHSQGSVWTIRALYPLIGSYALLSSLGLLLCFIKDVRKERVNSRTPDKEDNPENDQSKLSARMRAVLVSIMAAMFFIYVGMEVAFGTFISIFAVKSRLQFTRPKGYSLFKFTFLGKVWLLLNNIVTLKFCLKTTIKYFFICTGSTVTAVFWGTFAATRGLAILLAMVNR